MPASYENFDLHLSELRPADDGWQTMRAQVVRSPAGSQKLAETVRVSPALKPLLVKLAARELDNDPDSLIYVGKQLAEMMLPPGARRLFDGSYVAQVTKRLGLRLRLRCMDEDLDAIPWELAHLGSDDTQSDSRHYLALNHNLSLVRIQMGSSVAPPLERRDGALRRVISLMCDPPAYHARQGPLALDRERKNLQEALGGHSGYELIDILAPTKEALQDALTGGGAYCFHFAGHGEMRDDGGSRKAFLILQTPDGEADPWPVDEVALYLAGRGIELAVLGACDSAMRGGRAWSGIAPSLVGAGVPAVLGMQYDVLDLSAVSFSKRLYGELLASVSLEESVRHARLSVYGMKASGRDFATPVLYMRDADDAAPRPEPRPDTDQVILVLQHLETLYAYKRVHDALHKAKIDEVQQMRELCGRPARQRSTTPLTAHANRVRLHLDEVKSVVHARDDDILKDLVKDCEDTFGEVNAARAAPEPQAILLALTAFDSLLTSKLNRMDAAMTMLAAQLKLDVLMAFLQQLHDLRSVQDELRRSVRLHRQCQGIDDTLNAIRVTPKKSRMRELKGQWARLHRMLGEVQGDWANDARAQVVPATSAIATGVAENNDAAALQAFGDLCVGFDFGFRKVDTDLKDLCRDTQQPNHAVQAVRRGLPSH